METRNREQFIKELKKRTQRFAVDVILFCNTLKKSKASSVVTYQLVKSATSVGANYRAACEARSKREFFSKMCIVVEENDETLYWLEIIEAAQLSSDIETIKKLSNESEELLKIFSTAKKTAKIKSREQ